MIQKAVPRFCCGGSSTYSDGYVSKLCAPGTLQNRLDLMEIISKMIHSQMMVLTAEMEIGWHVNSNWTWDVGC